MFTFTISEKSHKFEGEWEGVYERVLREEKSEKYSIL